MFNIISKYQKPIPKKTALLPLLLGVMTVLPACTTVISADSDTPVGVIADYTPFQMEDDSFFSQNMPSKKVRTAQKPFSSAMMATPPVSQPSPPSSENTIAEKSPTAGTVSDNAGTAKIPVPQLASQLAMQQEKSGVADPTVAANQIALIQANTAASQ